MIRPRLSLDLLRGFHAAARHLSFTRAAQDLCVTQSAISREVRTLEEQLGTTLFRRVNRALQLTRAGQELYGVLYGRPWYDWRSWFDAKGIRVKRSSHTLTFSHYDQVIGAALKGSGVAVGKLPHLINHLSDGLLVAPLGDDGVATVGAFYLEFSNADRGDGVEALVAWLNAEANRDRANVRGP